MCLFCCTPLYDTLSNRLFSNAVQVIQYTPRGRAYNQNSPSLGATANVAFLAAFYAKAIDAKGEYGSLASRYWCWARTQTRYVLGDAGAGPSYTYPWKHSCCAS